MQVTTESSTRLRRSRCLITPPAGIYTTQNRKESDRSIQYKGASSGKRVVTGLLHDAVVISGDTGPWTELQDTLLGHLMIKQIMRPSGHQTLQTTRPYKHQSPYLRLRSPYMFLLEQKLPVEVTDVNRVQINLENTKASWQYGGDTGMRGIIRGLRPWEETARPTCSA